MAVVEVGRSNRRVTGRRQHENHAVRFRSENQESSQGHAADQSVRSSLTIRCKSVQALAPHGSRKKIWGKKESPLWVYVSPSISQTNNKLLAPFENKMRDTFLYIFTNPSARAGYDTRSILKRSLTGLNSEFSFLTSCFIKADEISLPYYLPIAGDTFL